MRPRLTLRRHRWIKNIVFWPGFYYDVKNIILDIGNIHNTKVRFIHRYVDLKTIVSRGQHEKRLSRLYIVRIPWFYIDLCIEKYK